MGCYFGNSPDAFTGYEEKFGYLAKVGVENRFRQKTACPDISTFCLNKLQKSIHLGVWFGFGSSMVFPNIWFFGRLGKKTNYGRQPLCRTCGTCRTCRTCRTVSNLSNLSNFSNFNTTNQLSIPPWRSYGSRINLWR